jgi:4-amino-4-deoxy-L-arabinose transferase-like glycosyltransferase
LIKIEQLFLLFLTALVVYFLTKRIFNEFTARISAIIVVIYPILSIFTGWLLSEILSGFILSVFLSGFYLAQAKKSLFFYGVAGVLLGIFILVKSAFIFLAILSAVLIYLINKGDDTRAVVTKILVFLLFFSLIVTPWILRNYVQFGEASIASRGGLLLYIRAVKTTYSPKDIGKYILSSAANEYVTRRFVDANYSFEQDGQGLPLLRQFKREKMEEAGQMSDDAMDVILRKEAINLIKSHPIKFFLYGFIELNNLNSPIIYQDRHFSMFHDNVRQYTGLKLAITLGLRFFWYLFVFLVFYGIYLVIRTKKRDAYFLILPVLTINITLFFLQGYPRSLMPILFLYFIFAIWGLQNFLAKFPKINLLQKYGYV